MINLYKNSESKGKNKSLFTGSKSHTASMNLKIPQETPLEVTNREILKHSYRLTDEEKPRSTHKYKKSLILQDTTIQLVKKSSQYYGGKNSLGMSTERLSKEKLHKRSVDQTANRIKTEIDEPRTRPDHRIEVNADQLKEMVRRLQSLKAEKENLRRQLAVYRREVQKGQPTNSVLKALAC